MGDGCYKIASKGANSTTYLFFMLKEKVLVSSSMVTLSHAWTLLISPFFLDDVAWSLLFYPQCFPHPNREHGLKKLSVARPPPP